eukprot:TRINITY_DN45670_c0_g1_i1.p1 TRINITY_DN45670_c0_g1~~TRINITY_DN45670_c0_g1_i1.p1  ORF type:complete len:716 (+),score=153.59 TRINITY_DN45670_c0_g1_i1:68-2215(+)
MGNVPVSTVPSFSGHDAAFMFLGAPSEGPARLKRGVVLCSPAARSHVTDGWDIGGPLRCSAVAALLCAMQGLTGTSSTSSSSTPKRRAARGSGRVVRAVVGRPGENSRWLQASMGMPCKTDDPDGRLMSQVSEIWLTLEPKLMYLEQNERLRTLSALCVAAVAHKDQRRKSGEPYLVHPVAVAELLASLKASAVIIIAGLLHDTIEDNDTIEFTDLEGLFGLDVRNIVEGETKASKRTSQLRSDEGWFKLYNPLYHYIFGHAPPGSPQITNPDAAQIRDDLREQAVNLRFMFLAMADDYRVIIVKLADRLHNMRTLEHMAPKKRVRISAETLAIFAPLAHRLGIWRFKSELEDLSFKYMYPEEYENLDRLLMARREQYRETMVDAARALEDLLAKDEMLHDLGVKFVITTREKGRYALFYKLQRKSKYNKDIDKIHDIVALRVVLDVLPMVGESKEDYEERERRLCYHVLALTHTMVGWCPGGGAFKDYIKYPKPNGYQSLHTTLMHDVDNVRVPLEVQIRTRRMHEVSEFGMAAHEVYKSDQRGEREPATIASRRVAWLASVKDKKSEADPIDFVEAVLREELGKRCYVFLRNGRIMNLSRNCTVLDAAFQIHKDVGMHMVWAEVNDRRVDPSYTLENGDTVNIVTSPDAGPKLEWVKHAWLRSTQTQLVQHFRKLEVDEQNKRSMQSVAGALATFATGMATITQLIHLLQPSS